MTNNVNAVANIQNGGALAIPASGNPFTDAAEEMGASSGSLFLKFDGNRGIYSFGRDNDELKAGTRVAINPSEFRRGWICWNDSKVLGEVMVPIVKGKPPLKSELEDFGPYEDAKDGWTEQSSVEFRDVETGDQYMFKTSSKGGRISAANLVGDYGKAFVNNPGKLAIVTLGSVSFDAKDKAGKKLGKKYAPAFKITSWEDEAALTAKFAAQDEDTDADPVEDVAVNTGGRRNRQF